MLTPMLTSAQKPWILHLGLRAFQDERRAGAGQDASLVPSMSHHEMPRQLLDSRWPGLQHFEEAVWGLFVNRSSPALFFFIFDQSAACALASEWALSTYRDIFCLSDRFDLEEESLQRSAQDFGFRIDWHRFLFTNSSKQFIRYPRATQWFFFLQVSLSQQSKHHRIR